MSSDFFQADIRNDKNNSYDILRDSREYWGSLLVPAVPALHHGDLGSRHPEMLSGPELEAR